MMGRPKLPKEYAKSVQIGVRFTFDENRAVEKAIAANDMSQTKSGFIRDAVLKKAKKLKMNGWACTKVRIKPYERDGKRYFLHPERGHEVCLDTMGTYEIIKAPKHKK